MFNPSSFSLAANRWTAYTMVEPLPTPTILNTSNKLEFLKALSFLES